MSPDVLEAMRVRVTRAEGALYDLRSILEHDVCCMCPNGNKCWPYDKFMATIARGLGETDPQPSAPPKSQPGP